MDFKGVSQGVEVYIIDYEAHEEDILSGYPLSGQRGDFICSLLGSMSLLDKTRMACWQGQGPDTVKNDILECNPKVIIGFGSELMNQFICTGRGITDLSGEVFDIVIGDQKFKYLVLVSPSYVLRRMNDYDLVMKFSQDLYKAFQITVGEFVDILSEKEVLSAHSFEEFKEIYDSHFLDDQKVAYDIETTARPIFAAGGRIIGFSIGNKTSGVYVSISALDWEMDKEEEDKIWDFLINEVFEKKDKLIIHNTMYERPYTLFCKGYEIGYDKAEDTLVMARLLRSPKEGAGLKYQAQKNLHYPDWETDLGSYIAGFRGLVNRVGFGPKKFGGIWSKLYSRDCKSIFGIVDLEEYQSLKEADQDEINDILRKVRTPMIDLYTDSEIYDIGELVAEKVIYTVDQGGILDSTIPYNYIPDRVLSKYGAIDAISTYDLFDFFMDMIEKESTDKVDLHKGYRNWKEHFYVAYIMERNGMFWNEELVKQDEDFLVSQATRCMKVMLKSPLFRPLINDICEWRFRPLILSDYLPQIAECQGYSVDFDRNTEKFVVKYQGKRVAKDHIYEIQIPDNFRSQYDELVYKMFTEEVDRANHFEELKGLYNPASSTQSDVPRKILMTEDLQMGGRITELHTLAVSPEFEDKVDKLPLMDSKFLKMAVILCDAKKLKAQYGDNWAQMRKTFYEGFCTLWSSCRGQVTVPEIKKILNNPHPVNIESFDDGGVIDIYNNLVVTGMDQDDPSTWSPQFEWMINFRLFKKSQKLITSYINGSVGRKTVVVVDKDSLQRGDICVTRKRPYEEKVGSDESYLLATKWSPNTAETGRWTSAIHTIPWGSQVKKYYTSRFPGGTTLCPDYSQMEVRTLAAISHDENMLELFRSGKDFHSQTAASVWQKPVEEITPAERRFSKTATFSLLYGAMEESFANNYCDGDMAMADKIYGGFFRAYPRVKEWVEERHQEVQRDHRVSLELSGRFIPIHPEGDGRGALNSMLRKSQNYPIQAQSADLTGCVIFDLQKYIEENHMKSLVIMYVHDSIEVDVYPYDLIQLVDKLKFLLNDSPMRRMGLPSKADVALGKSLGHEIEMKSIDYNEDFTDGVLLLEGYKDEIYETIETWKIAYKTVEILEEDWEEVFVSMSDLFILRKAYTPTLGTTRYTGTCKVHINYYN